MPSPKLLINLIKGLRKHVPKAVKTARVPKKVSHRKFLEKKPALIMSKPKGSQLYLEFDNRLGSTPNRQTIKKYVKSCGFDADIIKFKGGLKEDLTLGGIRDTTRYRLDVWKEGRLSSKGATSLSKMFGGDFVGPSAKLLGVKSQSQGIPKKPYKSLARPGR